MSATKRNRAKCAAMAKLEFEPVDEITFDPLSDERWLEKVKWLRDGLGFCGFDLADEQGRDGRSLPARFCRPGGGC